MVRKIVVQYDDGMFYCLNTPNERAPYRCASIEEAEDFSSSSSEEYCLEYHDFKSDGNPGEGAFKFVAYDITYTRSPNQNVLFADSYMDPLKATMMGRDFALSLPQQSLICYQDNPFTRDNPAYDHWVKGYHSVLAKRPDILAQWGKDAYHFWPLPKV